MKKIRKNCFYVLGIMALSLLLSPVSGMAAQTENAVDCDEGVITEPVAMVYGDSTAGCVISPATDLDRFSFSGTTGDTVRVNVLSVTNGVDPVLEVRNPSGTVIDTAGCDGSSGSFATTCSFTLELELPVTGNYFLSLSDSGTNEAGGYILQLVKILPTPVAPHLDYDTATDDVISPATDVDFFTFNGTVDTEIRLNLLSTSNGFDPVVQIRDPNGTVVVDGAIDGAFCNGSSGSFATRCSFAVNLLPTLPGTYSILVHDSGVNENGSYQLSLWCLTGPCDSDADGIPDPEGPVVSYITAVTDTIAPAVDANFFTFNGTVDTEIRLNLLSTSNGFDPVVQIRDPNGTVVVDGAIDGAFCNGSSGSFATRCSFAVNLLPTLPGTYSILVHDSGVNENGSYQLSLWCLTGSCDSDADGHVDGDLQIINYGNTETSKSISPAVDGDYYIFDGTAGDEVKISILSTTNGFDPLIQVRGPNDVIVINGSADSAFCNGSSGSFATRCSFSVTLLPGVSGTYSVLIHDSGINEAGGYQISLQCLFGTCANLIPPLICVDNCSETSNLNQADADGDGFGNVCDSDFDNNNTTDFADLAFMKSVFFTNNTEADMNSDGRVDFADLAILKSRFFTPPGPSCVAPNTP